MALCLAAGVAPTSLAWAGHAVMNDGIARYVHLGADIAHVLGASTWAGALTAFAMLSRDASSASLLSRTANGFARVGAILVAVLVATGLINYGFIVGPELPHGAYGLFLAAKLVLFASMLGLAAANRFRLAPRLAAAVAEGEPGDAMSALHRSVVVETGIALLVFAMVACLGIQSPDPV